jgi:eukaryotic-like serine/threonine-protein kinase
VVDARPSPNGENGFRPASREVGMAEKTEAFDRHQTASVPLEPAAAPASDICGRLFCGFRIVRKLGQGGMGQVYLAEQLSLKRLVALKFLKPQLAENKTALERFKLEALAVAKTSHANIVQIYDVGEEKGVHYMALEYVEGKNLREFIEKKGPPDVRLGLRIMTQVAAALQTASELGIVHRDIKPENILINRKGEVKVTDFGLSRHFNKDSNLTESRIAMGTPLYMSPEQVEGRPVDHRTDIYSFGVSCYHLFTGRPPFRGESPFEVALQHVNKEPTPLAETRPDLPIDLCRLVHKMMAKQPDQRYQNGREIQRDITKLRDALTSSGIVAAPVLGELFTVSVPVGATQQLTQSAIRPIRRRRTPWALVAAMFALLAGGAAAGWYLTPPPMVVVPTPDKVEKPDVPVVVQALFDPKQREKKLEQQVHDVLDMPQSKDRLTGIDPVLDYGALLLRERRLGEAETLFQKLAPDGKGPGNGYRWIVEFGQAMVLAQRDKFAESNKLFKSALDGIEKIEKAAAAAVEPKNKNRLTSFLRHWEKNLDWREQMASALQRNFDNSPKDFPADPRLESLRRPPGVVAGIGAKAAGAGP